MILNIDEVLHTIRNRVSCESIHVVKNYMQSGGHARRFLPKDCYYPETGTAETAICIKLSSAPASLPKIIVSEQKDSDARLTIFDRKVSYIFSKIKDKLVKDNG